MNNERYCLTCGVLEADAEGFCENTTPHTFEEPAGDIQAPDHPELIEVASVELIEAVRYVPPDEFLRTAGYKSIDEYLLDALEMDGGESIAACERECIIPYGTTCEHGHPAMTDLCLAVKFGSGATIEMLQKAIQEKELDLALAVMESEGAPPVEVVHGGLGCTIYDMDDFGDA